MEEFKHLNNLSNSNSSERMKEVGEYAKKYVTKYITNRDPGAVFIGGTQLARFFWDGVGRQESMKQLREILDKKLSGKNLVDLGCGNNDGNFPISSNISLKKFTAVDLDVPTPDVKNSEGENVIIGGIKIMQEKGIDASVVKEDILTYAASLPDRSSNFFLSAVDDDVISEEQYWKYLSEEILRATEDGGIVINVGGQIGSYLDNVKFKKIYDDGNSLGVAIYEKIA